MIINFLNELSGARLTFNYMRVGGVKWDAPDGWIEKVHEFIPYMREQLGRVPTTWLAEMKFF